MKEFRGYLKGMGIGGWLTNVKRIKLLPAEMRKVITRGDLEHFERYITLEDVKRIASFGVDHIRLAFDQIVIEDNDHPFTYRESGFQHVDRFIGWCKAEGLNVMLNLHKAVGAYCDCTDEGDLLKDSVLQDRFVKLWERLETRYHRETTVAFEILNEVNSCDSENWNALAGRTVSMLRSLNPTRTIVIGSALWNSVTKLKELQVYNDANIAYTFHFYDPFEFTHQKSVIATWNYLYNRDMPYPGDIEYYRDFQRFAKGNPAVYDAFERMDETFIRSRLQPAADWVKAHPDKILYAGEFGTIRHCRPEWRENWMRDVIRFLKQHDIPYCVWNYLSTPYDCNRFSLVDDDRREIVSLEMLRIIQGRV
ncbi:MAG: hypothetical protein A3K19_07520 [Lentisphaerae bacterium RIFOXYB12_FULL_65_16]|nr:MAG: hypothetical protein A3K18_21725 [Lentisphaerae bacterium RIFOXYA12_64_32]OGV93389.1 MAG: hypothetical protein A3K19_07520 [Lentisphaerae bacterium RIFOXYB12_FULL_65_16]